MKNKEPPKTTETDKERTEGDGIRPRPRENWPPDPGDIADDAERDEAAIPLPYKEEC